jgi:hypothetical protein
MIKVLDIRNFPTLCSVFTLLPFLGGLLSGLLGGLFSRFVPILLKFAALAIHFQKALLEWISFGSFFKWSASSDIRRFKTPIWTLAEPVSCRGSAFP